MNRDLNIRRYIFKPVLTNMYVFIEGENALVVDPCVSDDALAVLYENKIKYVLITLTHEHFDHTTGVNWIRSFFDCHLVCHEQCAIHIGNIRNNRPSRFAALLISRGENAINDLKELNIQPYACFAEETFSNELLIEWCGHNIKFKPTPGHSLGSCCIELDNEYLFTGDSLIKETPIITRFVGGDQADYNMITLPYLKSIPINYWILPGHGQPFHRGDIDLS